MPHGASVGASLPHFRAALPHRDRAPVPSLPCARFRAALPRRTSALPRRTSVPENIDTKTEAAKERIFSTRGEAPTETASTTVPEDGRTFGSQEDRPSNPRPQPAKGICAVRRVGCLPDFPKSLLRLTRANNAVSVGASPRVGKASDSAPSVFVSISSGTEAQHRSAAPKRSTEAQHRSGRRSLLW